MHKIIVPFPSIHFCGTKFPKIVRLVVLHMCPYFGNSISNILEAIMVSIPKSGRRGVPFPSFYFCKTLAHKFFPVKYFRVGISQLLTSFYYLITEICPHLQTCFKKNCTTFKVINVQMSTIWPKQQRGLWKCSFL